MLMPEYKVSFKKDLAKLHQHDKDIAKLIKTISMLVCRIPLPHHHESHSLKGNYDGYMDCHIEPDWVLIYKIRPSRIMFVRTGTHADLF